MELVAIVRILWRRRILVAIGVIAAVGAGLLAGHKADAGSVGTPAGVGTVKLVLDTADSQLVSAAPKGADTLSMRAALLANTMATRTARSTIARKAGIDERDLVVVIPAAKKEPSVDTPLVRRIVKVTSAVGAPYVVDITADAVTPIVSIQANAPDNEKVRRLTDAAVGALRSMLSDEDGSHSEGFVLDTVVPPRVEVTPSSSQVAVMMLAAAIATFAAWCLGIVVVVGVGRRWRGLGSAPDPVERRQAA